MFWMMAETQADLHNFCSISTKIGIASKYRYMLTDTQTCSCGEASWSVLQPYVCEGTKSKENKVTAI